MTLNTDFMRIADETNREERQYTVMISLSVYGFEDQLDIGNNRSGRWELVVPQDK